MNNFSITKCVSGYVVSDEDPNRRSAVPRRWAFTTFEEAMTFIKTEFDKFEEAYKI